MNIVKRIAAKLKNIDPNVFIIVGGHHATVKPEDYNCPYIDLVVHGEGVAVLREVMPRLAERQPFSDIAGLGIPGPQIYLTPARPHPSLDSLPFPDRSLTSRYRHSYFSEWMQPIASVRTSLGCVSRCSFCALWSITSGKYLRRQPEKVVEELKTIAEEYVFFCDDESMCDWRRMDKLADLIREAGIKKKYFLYARVDSIVKHPDVFAKWKEIGLVQAFVGTTDKPELYDFVHTVLPTTLPLREFYEEYVKLFSNSTTLFHFFRRIGKYGKGRKLAKFKDYINLSREFKEYIFNTMN